MRQSRLNSCAEGFGSRCSSDSTVTPRSFATGWPMKPATTPANIAESMETPINVSAPPMPMQASVAVVPPGLLNIPIAIRMRPGRRTALPAAMRTVKGRVVFPPVRKASSGVTCEAHAGRIAEASDSHADDDDDDDRSGPNLSGLLGIHRLQMRTVA